MASWTLVPCLVKLRSEFNALAPSRDKASDGSIGDTAHQANPTSDHNPDSRGLVHAIDVDEDLREPGQSMERCVQFLLGRCRSGAENRLKYVIYERRIWSASTGWRQEHYSGSNAHDKHAHFSASYTPAREASTASWHLEDLEMALTDAEKAWFVSTMDARLDAFGDRAPLTDIHTRTGWLNNTWVPAVNARLTAMAADDNVDEAAIIAGVLGGLNPAAIAAAIPLDIAERVADELRDRLAG